MAKLLALALLHQGLVKTKNEDNLYLLDGAVPAAKTANFERSAASADPLQFFAVADGMGGGGIGDLASQTILQVLAQHRKKLRTGGRFDFASFARDIIESGDRSVREQLDDWQGLPVGTTFSLLAIERDNAYTLSLGNSRVYLFRDNKLHQLTEDHIRNLPDRRRVTHYFGYQSENLQPETANLTRTVLSRGDILLLATDGITDDLTDDDIAAGLSMPVAFVQQVRHLRDLALRRSGRDNLALIGIKIQEPLVAEMPARNRRAETSPVEHIDQSTGKINQSGQSYAGRKIKGNIGFLQNEKLRRRLRPILFFLFFVLLGILFGKLLFSLPVFLQILFSS